MTLPVSTGDVSIGEPVDTLMFPEPPLPDPTLLLERALAADVSPGAFRLLAAAALQLPRNEFLAVDAFAVAARLTHHQARPLLAELARAGLMRNRRDRGTRGPKKVDVLLYAMAVTR